MTGKPFYKTRTITSERLVSPLAGRRDLNDAAIAFKNAVVESITRPTLNAGLSVKALSNATGSETYQDTDGKKRTSSGGTPGMVELPNGYNYVPSQKWEEGKFLQLFPSIKSRKTAVKNPNFGWIDKPQSLTASEYAKVIAASPKLRIRKYKVNQKTDEIIQESEQTLDPFSLNGDKTVATSGYGEKRLPGRTIGQRGRSLIARAANAFGILVDEAGKFRCPPGTPAANQFTDSTGANCFGISASDIFDFAQRMAGGIDLGDGAKIRNSAKGLFNFLSWLDNGGIPGLGRTVWRDQDGKRIRNIKKWREANRTSENSRVFIDGMIRAQDKLAQQDINIASLMDMLGVVRTDEKRKTNDDVFEVFQKLRESGAWTLDVSTRFSPEDVNEIIKARLAHVPGFSSLTPERQKSLIEADTERWYTTERALLESALDSFIADPEHMRTIKSIDFEIKNPFGPQMDEASTGGFTTPDTNRLMTVIAVDIPEIMNNQEALIPNLAPNERMRIDFIGGKTDSERATALTNFLVTVDGHSKQLAAMVEERAFARHIMKHEIAHTIQFQAFVREAERQIRTNGFINAVNSKGETVRVENIKDLNSGMIFRLMQKAGDGMDLESLKNALSRTDVVGFLAGDYPKMYFNDEKGAEWWALEAAAELWALRDLGIIYGDDIDAALEWMDDVSDGRYTDIRRRSDADGLLDIEASYYENLGPDPELSGNSIAEVKQRLEMEHKKEMSLIEDWSQDVSTTNDDFIDALAGLEYQRQALNNEFDSLEASGESKDSPGFKELNRKIKENNARIALIEKRWAERFSSPDKEKRSADMKSMRESVREKMFSEGILEPKEMAARARQEEIKKLKQQVNDMTSDEVIQKLADLEISLKEPGLSAEAKSVILEDKKIIRAIYKSKLDGSDDAKVWSKQRRELDTRIDEIVNPPRQRVLKKTKKLKTDKAGARYAERIQEDAYYAMSEEQGIAIEKLGDPAETDIGNLLDPDSNVAAIKNINRRYRRAQRSAGDLSPGSETAALEDQIETTLIPAMEAIDESFVPDDIEIEAEMFFEVKNGFKQIDENFDSRGFVSGRIITDESPHKRGEVRDGNGQIITRAGKEKSRVLIQVSKGDKGIFRTNDTVLGDEGTLVLPPGKMKVVDVRQDGTVVVRVQEQDNVIDVLDRLSASIGEEGPGATQHAKGTKKKIDRVANKYVALRRENGLSYTPSRPKREVEIEDKNVEVKREVISAGGSFGEPPSEDYVAEIGKAPLVQPAEADIKPDPVDPRTGRPQMKVVSRMNVEELVNRRAAVYRNLLDPDYANDGKGFQGTDRATLKSLDDELARRGEITTNLPQPPEFDPDYTPGTGKRAPYKTSSGSVSDPNTGREVIGIPQTREERKVVRATRANMTFEDVKRVMAGESPKDVMNDMSRDSLDPAVANEIARKSPEALIKDVEDAAVEFHAGIDKRPRVRMTENQLTKFANDGEFLPTETDETIIPGDAIGRRLERRLNPRMRREAPKLSSGAKYEELVRNQPRLSDEQIDAASRLNGLMSLPEMREEDTWRVTGKDPFGDDIEELDESEGRKKIKEDIKKAVETLFSTEIELDNDIIVESTSGEKINLGKRIIISPSVRNIGVEKLSENDLKEQNDEIGEELFASSGNPITQISVKMKIYPADEEASAKLIKSGLPESLVDPEGTEPRVELAYADRTITTDGVQTFVGHEILQVGKGARKYGIASAVNARNESIYKEIGVDSVFAFAQSSSGADQLGATHWARNGFTWLGEPSKQKFIGIIDDAIKNTPELFSDEERTRISSLYRKDKDGKFVSSSSPEKLIDFASADDVFRNLNDGDGASIYFQRDMSKPSGIDSVRNRARRRERSGARTQASPSLSSGAKVYRKIGRTETFQNENELGVKRGKEISEEQGKLSSGAIERTLKPGDLEKSPTQGFAKKEGIYGEERKTFDVYDIGGESVVFGGPTDDFEMESDTQIKNVPINPYAITGLDKTSEEGQNLSEKWAAAHAAHVEETGSRSTYVDALLYASVRGDEDATKEFERLAEIGLKRVAEEKEKAIEKISFSEDDLFQERKEGLDKIGIDDLYLVHETDYDPPLDADGNIILKPLSAYELTSNSGEKVTIQRHTIHFALNHLAGGHIARQQKPGSNVIVVRLRDVLENNPDSVDSLFPVDTVLTPKPGGGIKMPKGSFRVVKTTENGDSNDIVRTALKELGAKHFFEPGEFSSSPGAESAVRRIAKGEGFYYQIHSDMPHSFMEMNASGTEEQLGRLSTFELWPNELARMSKNAQKSVGISDKFTGTRNMMVDDGGLLSGLRTNARVSPKQRKIQLQKVNDAENYLRNLDLQIAEVDLVDSETGRKIKSPIFSVAGRPMVLVDVNGIRIPFYQSTGKGGKSNPIGKWYPIFGVGKSDLIFDREFGRFVDRGGWFNKGDTYESIDNYYDVPEFKRIANILNDIDDMTEIDFHNVGAVASEEETLELLKKNGSTGYAGSKLPKARMSINDDLWKVINRDLTPYSTVGEAERSGGRRWNYINSVIDRIEKNRVKLDINSVSVAVDKDRLSVSKESNRIKNRDVQLTVKDKNGDVIKVSVDSELETRFDDTKEQNLTVRMMANGVEVGVLHARTDLRGELGNRGELTISDIFVPEDYHRRGHGRLMLSLAEKYNIGSEKINHSSRLSELGELFASGTGSGRLSSGQKILDGNKNIKNAGVSFEAQDLPNLKEEDFEDPATGEFDDDGYSEKLEEIEEKVQDFKSQSLSNLEKSRKKIYPSRKDEPERFKEATIQIEKAIDGELSNPDNPANMPQIILTLDADKNIVGAVRFTENDNNIYINNLGSFGKDIGVNNMGSAIFGQVLQIASDKNRSISIEATPGSLDYWRDMGFVEIPGFSELFDSEENKRLSMSAEKVRQLIEAQKGNINTGASSGRLSSGARSGPSRTQRVAGIAGSRATGRVLDAVLKRSGADEDTRERVKYGVNMAGALAAGGPAGFATALAVDVARRAGREIAERALQEAVQKGKITQEQMNVAMSAVDRVAPNGLPDPVVDRLADAWSIASDFIDERVATDANRQRLDEFGNAIRAEGNEFVQNAGELVGSAREKIGRRFGRRRSGSPDSGTFAEFDENDYKPTTTEYDDFGDAFSSGKRAGRSSDVFRNEYNSRIGISKSTPNSAKPVSGYVVHRSHNEEKKRQIAASGKGNIGSDAIFEIGDNDIVGDGLTALGEIEVILKPEVSNRTAYGRGEALQSAHRPVAMNSNDPDDIADAIINADGIASKKQNTEAMLHLLGAKMDKNFSSVGASMDENGKMAPVGAVDSSARSHEPFEAQILGGFKKNEVEGIHYPFSKVTKIAESEDISDVVNEQSLASKLEKLGFTPEEIAYFYSISGGRPLNTASMVKLKEYRAAKKIKEQYEGMGIGYVKFAHPQGINIENPRSYDKTASPKTRVDEILKRNIDAEVEAELKKTLDSMRKNQQLDLMVN